ncbi:ABC transporter ATP-binding protein [Elysia marginata]|uniref:ABC transporter ATP-binding protein n=1 Tax=Elysia marginata TaxID=1093978 RepID=A0AAV4EL69_9GAST|nr:ABC transporter ATP-binding protein [Elysia marginata]
MSLTLSPNEILGIIGESGSGKSVLAMSILRLLRPSVFRIDSGEIYFEKTNLLQVSQKMIKAIRGNEISMVFQEPMSALNPVIKCGKQVEEVFKIHTRIPKSVRVEKVLQLFEKVRLHDPKIIFNKYPHQISGGQKQRVIFAMAMALDPKLLIADEPTTALDKHTQLEIVDLIKTLQKETGMSVLFISHDLNLIKETADRLIVMRYGETVETNTPKNLFEKPCHPYTKALVFSLPKDRERPKRLPTIQDFLKDTSPNISFESDREQQEKRTKIHCSPPLLELKNIGKVYQSKAFLCRKEIQQKVLERVNFSIYAGETLGLVGESGSGKSTLGNLILKLIAPSQGQIFFNGVDITALSQKEMQAYRSQIQMIFQDPFESLNPLLTVGSAILETLKVHRVGYSHSMRKEMVMDLLKKVGLDPTHFYRYPHQFSGGQRQRIGIARSIAMKPKLVICDEVVSALDISIRAQVLNLLNDLKEQFGFGYLFISHNMQIVRYMSDRIIHLEKGCIKE